MLNIGWGKNNRLPSNENMKKIFLILLLPPLVFSEYKCSVIGSQSFSKIEVHEKEKYLESFPEIRKSLQIANWDLGNVDGEYFMIMHTKEWSMRSIVDGEMKYFPESTEEYGCDKFENKKDISYVCNKKDAKQSYEYQNYVVIDKDELTMEIERTYLPPANNPYNDVKEKWEISAICSNLISDS